MNKISNNSCKMTEDNFQKKMKKNRGETKSREGKRRRLRKRMMEKEKIEGENAEEKTQPTSIYNKQFAEGGTPLNLTQSNNK